MSRFMHLVCILCYILLCVCVSHFNSRFLCVHNRSNAIHLLTYLTGGISEVRAWERNKGRDKGIGQKSGDREKTGWKKRGIVRSGE